MRKSYKTAILSACEAAKTIAVTAEKAERDLTDGERDAIETHLKQAEVLQETANREDELRGKMDAMVKTIGLVVEANDGTVPPLDIAPRGSAAERKAMTVGQTFIKSGEFTGLMKSLPNGRASEKMHVQSGVVAFKSLFTGADHDTDAGALIRPDYRGLLDPYYEKPLTIRSIVGSGSTTSDSLEYVRMVSTTNNAAVVAEATSSAPIAGAVTPVMGGLKPESGFEFEKDSTTVKTIAHWIPATKRALSDASQIRSLIDSFLRYGLEEALEGELVSGNGTGEHFLGIMNTSGIQTQAAPGTGQDVFDITRMARRKVNIGGRAIPTAYVMNPIDWEKIELKRDANNVFYGGGPFSLTTPHLWGLPVIESEAIPVGTAFVGAWNYAVLYDREQASVQVTDSHNDYFIRNLVAILAEMRAAFAVLRPPAFVQIHLV
jgi:HK97 family phage major capsid protein